MKEENELTYYEKVKDWNFDSFEIESDYLTNWNLYELLNKLATKDSKILDLGTGGGEKVLKSFPECKEILATDYSQEMINTANENLKKSGRKNITFKVMDNLKMNVPDDYFDFVVARNTPTDPKQIYKCLKDGGYLFIHGVDKFDCYALKLIFKRGQGTDSLKPISIVDYENVLEAGFKNVELIPLHVREYFKNRESFKAFLQKVPIINDFGDDKDKFGYPIEDDLLDQYIEENTYNGKIRLLRRYYGIVAQKQKKI